MNECTSSKRLRKDVCETHFIIFSLLIVFLNCSHYSSGFTSHQNEIISQECYFTCTQVSSDTIVLRENNSFNVHFAHFPKNFIADNHTVFVHENYSLPPTYILRREDRLASRNHLFAYQKAFGLTYNFYHLRNIFYGASTQFVLENSNHSYTVYYLDNFAKYRDNSTKTIRYFENHAIALSAAGTQDYGDMVMASFVRMITIPTELFSFSKLIVRTSNCNSMFYEVLEALKLPKCCIVPLGGNELIFCSNLFTVLPIYTEDQHWIPYCVHLNFFGPMMREFGNKMRQGFNAIEPHEYTLYNRFKGVRRSFVNFDEIVNRVREEYPGHNFTTIIGHYSTLKETVRRYGAIKWLFAVAGSNSMNSIFMKARTCVCMYMASFYDSPAIGSIVGSDICIVAYMNPEQKFCGPPLVVNITRLMPFIKKSMEILDSQSQQM